MTDGEFEAWPVEAVRGVVSDHDGYGMVEVTLQGGRTIGLAVPTSLLPGLAHAAIAGLPKPSGGLEQEHKAVFATRSALVGVTQNSEVVLSFELAQGENLSVQLTRDQTLALAQGIAAALGETGESVPLDVKPS